MVMNNVVEEGQDIQWSEEKEQIESGSRNNAEVSND